MILGKIKRKIDVRLRKIQKDHFWKEKVVEKKGEKYMIIRRKGWKIGLFSYFITNLGYIKYAVDQGYIPVIDMGSYSNIYLSKEDVEKINVWEVFFKQPMGIGVGDAKKGSYILTSGEIPTYYPSDELINIMPGLANYQMWKDVCNKYIDYSDNAKKEIEYAYNQLIFTGDRVLGVLCRGTDYTSMRPKNHPVQPTPEMVMEKVDELLRTGNYNKIFLATEDETVWKKFQLRFGDIVVSNVAHRIHYDKKNYLVTYMPETTEEKLKQGMEYLVSIALLAKCDAFLGGRTSGTAGVMLLSKGFEYQYIWDLGRY